MILDNKLFQQRTNQKAYLVYLINECEMGTEGWSGWSCYAVAHGSTDEEIYKDWVEQCKHIYGIDHSEDLVCKDDKWYCYYELAKAELPSEVYGNAKQIKIEGCYDEHTR